MSTKTRKLSDCTHEYLVDRVLNNEHYINDLVQLLLQFHPYLGPAINEIGEQAVTRHNTIEATHPPSGLILPPSAH